MHSRIPFLLAATLFGTAYAGIKDWLSPEYKWLFQYPLPIPTALPSLASHTNTTTGKTIDYYEMTIEDFEKQVYPNLGKTSLTGYNGMAPGPTLYMTKGREAIVRFINKSQRKSSIHLHGSYSRTAFDGWASDEISPGEYKDYYYPNAQPMRTLWYHDHALGITAVNAYFGQAGFYLLNDPVKSAELQLPEGKYDIPLMLASKQFQSNGQLFSPEAERDSLWGDVNTVNGQPWPYLSVENRKYKFRLLDASISRSYKLYLVADDAPNTRIPFDVVGADAGYMDHPVSTKDLVISMAERWEIIIDFAKYKGKNITMMNERDFQTNDDFPQTHKIMRFMVDQDKTSDAGNGPIPAHLADLALPTSTSNAIDKEFVFERTNGEWRINGVGFEDVENRILAKPKQGSTQRWKLVNKSGGWSHPIHIHLIDMKVIRRTGSGREFVEPYEAAALKDVVYLGRNEEVEVLADFAPWSGLYMFHCHNLVHEDHDMMAAFNVTKIDLSELGYPESVDFGDPMSELFCAKPYSGTNINQVSDVMLPYFQNLNAYPDAKMIIKALEDYNKNPPTSSSSTVVSTTVASTTTSTTTSPTITSPPTTTAPSTFATSVKTTTTSKKKDDDDDDDNSGSGKDKSKTTKTTKTTTTKTTTVKSATTKKN